MRDRMIEPVELAQRWKIHVKTLGNWRVQGRGPAYVKMGGRNSKVLYREADVLAYEAAGLRKPMKERA